jgi:two-component sensor histidine kinase
VHYRVKNNLTLLNSLLYLRGKASDDQNVIDVLNECQARVQTMSIVHQNLYDVDDASKVNFNKFLNQLTVESFSLMDCNDKRIKTKKETNEIYLEMGSAVSLGLILNELITSSLKYAFEGDRNHEIAISLKLEN